MSMFDLLEEKNWFFALGIIPIIILFFLVLQIWKHKTQNKFANKQLLKKISPNISLFKSVLKLIVLCCIRLIVHQLLINQI